MKTIVLAALAACLVTGTANAAVINFESEGTQYYYGSAGFSENGYNLTYNQGSSGFAQIAKSAQSNISTNGSYDFYSFNTGSLTITAANGGAFSLSAFDAAQTFIGYGRTLTLLVSGVSGGNAVSQMFNIGAGTADAFTTQTTSRFTNLSSLTFAGTAGYPQTEFALDNIHLDAASAVPEPASWAMMLVGVGMVGFAMRRRARVATAVRFA